MPHFFVRPVTLKTPLGYIRERLGIEDKLVRIPVVYMNGEIAVWPVTKEQLRRLLLLPDFVLNIHYVVYTQAEGKKARFATRAFLDELARQSDGISIKRTLPRRLSRKKVPQKRGRVVYPVYEYFIRIEGDFPLTLKEYLESRGMSTDEESFVRLPVWNATEKVLVLPVEKSTMLALYAANRLNYDWRRILYFQRSRENPDATLEQVPSSVFHPNKKRARDMVDEALVK